jgi:5-methylcytosine-specific restriction endonuclease McrA
MTCPRCGNERTPTDFAKDNSKASGRMSHCKTCDNASRKRYYEANRDRVLAEAAAKREERLGPMSDLNCNKCGASFTQTRRSQLSCAACRVKKKARQANYGGWTGRKVQRTRRAIYQRDDGICQICGQPAPFDLGQVDHIVPRSMGGNPSATNMRWAHATCNNGRRLSDYANAIRGGALSGAAQTNSAYFPLPPLASKSSRDW